MFHPLLLKHFAVLPQASEYFSQILKHAILCSIPPFLVSQVSSKSVCATYLPSLSIERMLVVFFWLPSLIPNPLNLYVQDQAHQGSQADLQHSLCIQISSMVYMQILNYRLEDFCFYSCCTYSHNQLRLAWSWDNLVYLMISWKLYYLYLISQSKLTNCHQLNVREPRVDGEATKVTEDENIQALNLEYLLLHFLGYLGAEVSQQPRENLLCHLLC